MMYEHKIYKDKVFLMFIRFLKNHNIYSKYKTNLYNSNSSKNLDNVLNAMLDRSQRGMYNFIDASFTWSKTKEGFTFWQHYNHKFRELCRQKTH